VLDGVHGDCLCAEFDDVTWAQDIEAEVRVQWSRACLLLAAA
jgi:hypothetical protein